MNKDRIDNSAQPLMKDSYVYEEVTLVFAPVASPTAQVATGTRRLLTLPGGDPFVLPAGAVLLSLRCVPYPADATGLYTGALTAGQRALLPAEPRIELRRNTDVANALAAADNPIKVFAVTEVPGTPDTRGLATNGLVIPLTLATIGAGTQYKILGEDSVVNVTDGPETDSQGMTRSAGPVFPHALTAQASDAVVNAPGRIVGITSNGALSYDVAIVLYYRVQRASFSLREMFPPDLRDE
jgi:hypothetical protein